MQGPPLYIYISLWATALLITGMLCLRNRRSYALFQATYWRFLFRPWKAVTFLTAASGLTVIAPYTGDPTWDYFDALFMSVLAYATAPWSVGVIYKSVRRELPIQQAFVAICVWMFSASWSYDLYLVIRDGHYPITWLPNIFASSMLYISAGLFWNLDWKAGRGVIFAFMEKDWPVPSSGPAFSKIFWFALPFMILVASMILSFLWL